MTEDRAPKYLIELDAVTKSYTIGGSMVTALDSVSLTIEAGEFVVILGPSGSGKTTLLNMIGALDTPTSGRITVAGRNITDASRGALFEFRRHTVSFIFQTFNLFPGLSARENVEFAVDAAGKNDRGSVASVLANVGLGERLDHFPHQLSGGEQQRVAIARALAADNSVLLADEPTGELDFRTGAQILELLLTQAGGERVVIVVTHNREISRIADRVIELSSGKIVSDGPPSGGRANVSSLRW